MYTMENVTPGMITNGSLKMKGMELPEKKSTTNKHYGIANLLTEKKIKPKPLLSTSGVWNGPMKRECSMRRSYTTFREQAHRCLTVQPLHEKRFLLQHYIFLVSSWKSILVTTMSMRNASDVYVQYMKQCHLQPLKPTVSVPPSKQYTKQEKAVQCIYILHL